MGKLEAESGLLNSDEKDNFIRRPAKERRKNGLSDFEDGDGEQEGVKER